MKRERREHVCLVCEGEEEGGRIVRDWTHKAQRQQRWPASLAPSLFHSLHTTLLIQQRAVSRSFACLDDLCCWGSFGFVVYCLTRGRCLLRFACNARAQNARVAPQKFK